MTDLKELNAIVSDIITADCHDTQLKAGQRLLAYTVRKDIDRELAELAENIAMLMIQKEGRDLHLEFMDKNLQKTSNQLHQAKHDPLTGLPNRGLFHETLDAVFEKAQRKGGKLALLLLDLDKFKPVNDTHGHDAGDELLSQVGERIKSETGDAGISARLGGDEFVVLLPDLKEEEEAFTTARKILLSLKKPFDLTSATVFINSSIGISFLEKTTKGPRSLLKQADLAMYEAKKAGRGRYVVHTEKK
ncbi:MAG: GGDEF domain-containing protein [Desulfobacteraceae bacterium]|nr:GGDEF domain-containing protein [Desulfobacteraceae bacterium]